MHRKIDDAFPLNLRSSQSKFAARGSDGLGVLSASVSGEHASRVETLLVAIDSKNNTLMAKFRAAYLVYTTNPCCRDEYFANQVKQLCEMHDRLTEVEIGTQSLIAVIKSTPTDNTSILALFRELVNKVGLASPALNSEGAKLAIDEATDDAKKWIGARRSTEGEGAEG